MERQATLLGKTKSGIQIAKLIQCLCLNFPLQNNQIGCRGEICCQNLNFIADISHQSSHLSALGKLCHLFLPRKHLREFPEYQKS